MLTPTLTPTLANAGSAVPGGLRDLFFELGLDPPADTKGVLSPIKSTPRPIRVRESRGVARPASTEARKPDATSEDRLFKMPQLSRQ